MNSRSSESMLGRNPLVRSPILLHTSMLGRFVGTSGCADVVTRLGVVGRRVLVGIGTAETGSTALGALDVWVGSVAEESQSMSRERTKVGKVEGKVEGGPRLRKEERRKEERRRGGEEGGEGNREGSRGVGDDAE